MFESTTHFDFDDDVILDTSFKPTTSSTQASQVPKGVCEDEESEKEHSKRQKFKEDSGFAVNKCILKRISNDSDTFTSPNRVVRRKFPGPAGLLPEIGASNKSILQLLENERLKNDDIEDMPILSQQTSSVFENGPWKEMRKDFQDRKGENLIESFNIKWIKRQALKQLLNHKAPFLAAIIQNLDIVDGRIPTINVTLKDVTGDIRGTILHSLYTEHSGYFRIGSVLVLKQFGVLSAGYNNHCLTITANNLISIYCSEVQQKLPNENFGNVHSQKGSGDSVKKIVIQDCNMEEILKKYNEDVQDYSQEKQKKINFGNLYRNSSEEVRTSSKRKNDSPFVSNKLMSPHVSYNPQRSSGNTSTGIFSANSSGNVLRNANSAPEASSTAAMFGVDRHESPTKKKFSFKKQFGGTQSGTADANKNRAVTDYINSNQAVETCDTTVITSNHLSVTPEKKEHAEIWKNLLDGVDTDSLFDDF